MNAGAAGARRLGLVGAGAMAARIAKAAASSGCFEIAAVADIDVGRAERLANEFGASAHPDASAMLETGAVDAVYLGLPPALNRGACEAAALADVHVLIDKPVATTAADGDAIAALAAGSSKAWMVGFSYRFRAEWQRAQQVLASGRLGAVTTVTDVIVEAATPTPAWYWSPDLGGGLINLQSHHCFDRIGWLLDSEVVDVACSTWRLPSGGDTSAHILCRYETGSTAVISLAFGTEYTDDPRTLFVALCERGAVQIDADRRLRITDADGTRTTSYADDDWLAREVEAFAAAAADPPSASPDITDGIRALESAVAAVESASRGCWVAPTRHRARV